VRSTLTLKCDAAARPASPGTALEDDKDHVAVEVARHVQRQTRDLRLRACGLLVTILLTTVALNSYPFRPQRLLTGIFALEVAAAMMAFLWLLIQMDRNAVLSQIAGTTPGKVTWDLGFVFRLILFILVPLLSGLGVMPSPVSDLIGRIVNTFLGAS
jgi:hypothetical protein